MRIRRQFKHVTGNICIICSIALLIIFILDWYNPYMDFLGHAKILLYPLCICSVYMGLQSLGEKEERLRIYRRSRRV